MYTGVSAAKINKKREARAMDEIKVVDAVLPKELVLNTAQSSCEIEDGEGGDVTADTTAAEEQGNDGEDD